MKHIIVYGPKGCGKTHNREAIGKHFNADMVIDDWEGNELFDPAIKGPFTGGAIVWSRASTARHAIVVYMYTTERCVLPLPLPDRPQGDELVAQCYVDIPFLRKESDDPLAEPGLSEPRDNASIFQSSRTETDRPSDEDLMRTIIDACDELRYRGHKVEVSDIHDPAERPNTRTTHVSLTKTMKGDAKCNDQQQ